MNKSITRKLILSVASLAATTICLTSTTYAWFAKNANAWTEDFIVKIHTFEGLQISVDGENFYDSIDRDQLLKAMALSRYNLENDEPKTYNELTSAEVAAYGQTVLAPVSPDSNFNFYGFGAVDNPTEGFDIFLDIDNKLYKPINLTAEKKSKSYAQFDLYFKAIPSSNDPKDSYKLTFVDEVYATEKEVSMSYVEAEPSTVKLFNSLNIPVIKDTRDNPLTPGLYKNEDEISINPKDAMRIGVRGTNGDLIYEINEGYGSSAYENYPTTNADFDLHDPNQNPMVTYFNNLHKKGDLYVRDYSEYVETIKNFDSLESLGRFNRNDDGTYNNVKITVYLWLDGYDADYLEGVNTDSVHFYLNFTKVGE